MVAIQQIQITEMVNSLSNTNIQTKETNQFNKLVWKIKPKETNN
jgi:hypothetical protein